jgi:hypothetical protein
MTTHYELINFDSIYSINQGNPFQATFKLSSPLRNFTKIYLKSIEMLVSFPNIRASSNLSTFTFLLNNTQYSFTLADKVYNNVQLLIVDLNNAIIALNLSVTITFQINPNNNTQFQIILGSSATFLIVSTNFTKYILNMAGCTNGVNTNLTVNAIGNYVLNCDNYVNMYISNIPNRSINNAGILCSYKVPLNASSNSVYYTSEGLQFGQYIKVTDKNVILDKLDVTISDRFENVINSNGVDYSWTIAVEFEH